MSAKTTAPDRPSDRLRSVIQSRGLTPTSVARAAGVAPSVITRFVNGQRGLTLDTFDLVTSALGLKLVEGPRRGPQRRGAVE